MDINLVFFSDTHNRHKDVVLPACDICFFTGDCTSVGYKHELESFLSWYNKQAQCTFKVFIAGNHDLCFDPKYDRHTKANTWLTELLASYPDLIYLENSSVELMGLKIWGSPITPWFYGDNWAFNKHRGEPIKEVWGEIPLDTDIVLTHGPAANIRDYVSYNDMCVGCDDLLTKLFEVKPKVHACGHIHDGYGVTKSTSTTHINASICDEAYNPTNTPIELTITI